MTTKPEKRAKLLEAKVQLLKKLKEVCEKNPEIEIISLATTDGFNLGLRAIESKSVSFDKMAALSSSLSALSQSVAEQLGGDRYTTSIIESEERHILFTRLDFQSLECVLTLVATSQMVLAKARFKIFQIKDTIEAI